MRDKKTKPCNECELYIFNETIKEHECKLRGPLLGDDGTCKKFTERKNNGNKNTD